VMLMFENGDPRRPLIVGFVESPEPSPQSPPVEARVDGKRIVIEGEDEVVLQCGEASITLRRNGKVIIEGTYVETHSRGVNRIKGGSVQIN
jgi:hypothetical protein